MAQDGQTTKQKARIYKLFTIFTEKKAVKYLLMRSFFQLRSKIFRQIIVVSMRSDPGTSFVNLESKENEKDKHKKGKKICKYF